MCLFQGLLGDIHENVITHVKDRRGEKLDTSADLFTGEVWLARRAQELGLIEGIAHLKPMMQARYGEKAVFKVHGPRRSFMQRLGAGAMSKVSAEIEERALYARFGL
mgnify:CR=1 FL=1